VVDEAPELDAKRFRRTDNGVCLITQTMIDQLQTCSRLAWGPSSRPVAARFARCRRGARSQQSRTGFTAIRDTSPVRLVPQSAAPFSAAVALIPRIAWTSDSAT
jgi:hypothetical protein